jgi:hypothetical protein
LFFAFGHILSIAERRNQVDNCDICLGYGLIGNALCSKCKGSGRLDSIIEEKKIRPISELRNTIILVGDHRGKRFKDIELSELDSLLAGGFLPRDFKEKLIDYLNQRGYDG